MAAVDGRARELLARTESMGQRGDVSACTARSADCGQSPGESGP